MNQKIKTNDIATQIEYMLEEAWNKFFDYYKKNASKYRKLWELNVKKLDEKDATKSHWICWNEYDLMFYIGRFFHDILKEKGEEFKNIEIHFEKKIDSTNFGDYTFKGELNKKKGPKVDMIVAYEDKNDPFLLCAEVKCFHGGYRESPISAIQDDIEKLKAIKDSEIAKRVVFMLFDDYYWWQKNKKIADEIEKKRIEIENDEKIDKVLFARSEAKLEKYQNK